MSMEHEITEKTLWLEIESSRYGTWWVLAEYAPDWEAPLNAAVSAGFINPELVENIIRYTEIPNVNYVDRITLIRGYGARLSMPGYLDCTEWCVFKTLREARKYLKEMYGDD